MRQRIVAIVSMAWLWLAVAPAAVSAQQGPAGVDALAQRIEALQKELDVLRERAVQVPTLADAIQQLGARLAALESELAVLAREQRAIPDTIKSVDALTLQTRKLAVELEGLRTQLAHLEQPWTPPLSGVSGPVEHRGGFHWLTVDERYAIRLAGYLQARYQLAASDGEITGSTLALRRARLGISGHAGSEKMAYALMLSLVDQPVLLDGYIDYALHDQLAVRLGQYKTQFTRSFINSSSQFAFVERSQAVERMRYDRDIQVGLRGSVASQRVGFYVGAGNGAGLNRLDDNRRPAITARVNAALLGERSQLLSTGDLERTSSPVLAMGAGAIHDWVAVPGQIGEIMVDNDLDGDGDADDVRVLGASLDATFRYRGVEVALEALLRRDSTDELLGSSNNAALLAAVGDRRTHLGMVGELSYVLPWPVLIGARVGWSQLPFLGVGGRPSSIPLAESLLEVDGVIQLYRDGARVLGLMYSFHDYGDSTQPASATAHRAIVEAQLVF